MAATAHLSDEQIEAAGEQAGRRVHSRRRFLALLGSGGAAAVVVACQAPPNPPVLLTVAPTSPSLPPAPTAGPTAPPLLATQPPTAVPTAPAPRPTAAATAASTTAATAAPTLAPAPPAAPSPTATAALPAGIYPPNGRLVVGPAPDQFFRPIGGPNFEMRFEDLAARNSLLTPNSFFFMRSHDTSIFVDPKVWRLRIEGDGVEKPLELTYDELLKLPATTVTRYVECAGNGRSFYASMMNKPAQGGQWHLGAWGVAEWTGVAFLELLQRAGIKKTAVQVMPVGLDKPRVARPITVAKAMEPDTILAYMMNGEILPPDHGFPVRAITPGMVGVNNIKWVGSIQVSEKPLWTDYNTKLYVLIGPDYKAEAPGDGPPVNDQVIKSALALPWPATMPTGEQKLSGYAWSPAGKIAKVEFSLDDGQTWRPANLVGPNVERAGTRFEFTVDLKPGEFKITPRATDEKGNTQPPLSAIKWNQQGYIFAAPVGHPVTVSSSVTTITQSTPTPTPAVTPTAPATAGAVAAPAAGAAAGSTPAAPAGATPQAVATSGPGQAGGQAAGPLAAAGATVYANSCAVCHGAQGEGVVGPGLIGPKANLVKYGDAGGLYAYIQKNMPFSAPGSLTPQQYLQVTAYVLLQNNYVKAETPLDQNNLSSISLKR